MLTQDDGDGGAWLGQLPDFCPDIRVVTRTAIEAPQNTLNCRMGIGVAAVEDCTPRFAVSPKDDHVAQLAWLNLLAEQQHELD